jgi:hypothetical protein
MLSSSAPNTLRGVHKMNLQRASDFLSLKRTRRKALRRWTADEGIFPGCDRGSGRGREGATGASAASVAGQATDEYLEWLDVRPGEIFCVMAVS